MTSRRIRVLLFVGVVLTIVVAALTGKVAGDIVYFGAMVPLCALTWWGALRNRTDGLWVIWTLLAITQTLTITGDALAALQAHFWDSPVIGPADVFWLGSYLVRIAPLVLMARRRGSGQLRGAALDALTLATAAAVGSYLFFIEPLFPNGGLSLGAVVLSLYPIGDVFLLAGVLVLMLSPGRIGTPARLLLAFGFTMLISDVGFNTLPILFPAYTDWVDRLGGLAVLANFLIAAAVLHPDRSELTKVGQQLIKLHPARAVMLGISLVTAPVMAVAHTNLLPGAGIVVLAATIVCAALVLVRFMIAVREQERAQEQLAFQAQHDLLTGLANRSLLGKQLDEDGPVVLLYLDLDGFKAVNDTYGHDAGDAVLVAVADRISGATRAGDLVARLGGDEFVVACPGATTADGIALAERILTEVNVPVPFGEAQLEVGASIGIAVQETGGRVTAMTTMRSADEAMYQAKRLGRGRWVLAG